MDDQDVPSALPPEQWAAVLGSADALDQLRARFAELPFSMHALAALLLYEQPFGFTDEDVGDEREVAEYCEVMSGQHAARGDVKRAAQFFELASRHRRRAEKIQALLPPIAPGVDPP